MKRFSLFKAMEDCNSREEFDFQSTKAWHKVNGLDYTMLNCPTLSKYEEVKKGKKELTNDKQTKNDKKEKYVNSKMTYEEYRSLVKKARASFTHYKTKGKKGQLDKHLDKLANAGYGAEYSDTKLDIDKYKKPSLV